MSGNTSGSCAKSNVGNTRLLFAQMSVEKSVPNVGRFSTAFPAANVAQKFGASETIHRVALLSRMVRSPLRVALRHPFVRCMAMLACVAALGCAAPASPPARAASPPSSVVVPRTVITPESTTSVPELFQQASVLAAEGRHLEAASKFQRVVELEPRGELAHEALFQLAVEAHHAGQLERALAAYEENVRRFPDRDRSVLALVRAIAISLHLERWQRAGELAQVALASESSLGPLSRVQVYAGGALSRLAADDEKGAEWFIEKGRALIDEQRLDAAGRISEELAPLYFALGELRRRRGERIVFVPTPKNFAEVMESRCQLLLDAQSAYSDSFRAYDAHWSSMAGFRVGELYERLHRDLMAIEPPVLADTDEKRRLFAAAMRLRYAILLEKAAGMLQHTLTMAQRTGEASPWVERSRVTMAEIRAAQQREQEALAALPYSRATLEAALQELATRSQATGSAASGKPQTPSPPATGKPAQAPPRTPRN